MQKDPKKQKKPYVPPKVHSSEAFATMVLACKRIQAPGCLPGPYSSTS